MLKKIVLVFCVFVFHSTSIKSSDKQSLGEKLSEAEIVKRLDFFNQQQQASAQSNGIVLKERPQVSDDEKRRNEEIKRNIGERVIPGGRFKGKTVAQAAQIMADEKKAQEEAARRKVGVVKKLPDNPFLDEPSFN